MKKEDITGLFDVTGKVAIILGGAGAIGRQHRLTRLGSRWREGNVRGYCI
jgi:hypothetical protein